MFGVLLGHCCWVTADRCYLFHFRLVMTFETVTKMLTTGHTICLEMSSIFNVKYSVSYIDIHIKEINTVNINLMYFK